MKVVTLEGSVATVELADVRQQCDVTFVPAAKLGDYVIVHAGFAIEVLDEEEARETLELLDGIGVDVGGSAD